MVASLPPPEVLAEWRIAAPLEPLTGGHRNAAFRSRGVGRDLVVKGTRRSDAALRWLGPVMDAAEAVGFAVPRLIASTGGRLAVAGWACEPFLEGRPFGAGDMAGLAGRIADLHRHTARLPQRPGFVGAADLAAGAVAGADVDLAAMPPPLARALRTALGALEGLPRTAIHGDLGPGNLRCGIAGNPVLLDWDEARVDAALFDMAPCGDTPSPRVQRALLAWEIACCWQVEPERAAGLARGFMADGQREP